MCTNLTIRQECVASKAAPTSFIWISKNVVTAISTRNLFIKIIICLITQIITSKIHSFGVQIVQ